MAKIDFESTLKYINELIKGTTFNSDFEKKLTIDNLKEIRGLVFTLAILDEKGITTQNYHREINAYIKFKKKALEKYGVKIKDGMPFSSPSSLINKIDLILVNSRLTNEEKNEFYTYSELRERSPSKGKKSENSTIIKIFKKVTEKGLTIEDLVNDITSEEEQTFKQNDEITENNDEIIIHHTLLNYNKQNIQHLDNILEQTFQ